MLIKWNTNGKEKNREDYKEIEMRAEITADKELTVPTLQALGRNRS